MSQADEKDPALSPTDEARLLLLLGSALRPPPLDPQLNERLISSALEDPLAPPSPEELVQSARLRGALESLASGAAEARGQHTEHADAATLQALRLAFQPVAASDELLARAAGSHTAPATHAPPSTERLLPKKRANVVYAAFGAASIALSLAAGFALLVGAKRSAPVAEAPSLVKPRSTSALFSERFEVEGTTARIDRIASARSRDLRDNRYAAWGVR